MRCLRPILSSQTIRWTALVASLGPMWLGSTPVAAQTSISFKINVQSVEQSAADPAEALLAGAAAAFFGMDTDVFMSYSSRSGSLADTISLFYVSGETDHLPETIIADRDHGGWAYVEEHDGVTCHHPPGKAKGWDKHHSCDAQAFPVDTTIWVLSQYYAVTPDTIIVWQQRGLSLDDAALVLNVAARARVAPTTVVGLRLGGESWSTIAARYRLTVAEIERPVPPVHAFGKPVHVDDGHGRGRGHGKH